MAPLLVMLPSCLQVWPVRRAALLRCLLAAFDFCRDHGLGRPPLVSWHLVIWFLQGEELLRDLLAIEVNVALNAAFCERHLAACPPSEQLETECAKVGLLWTQPSCMERDPGGAALTCAQPVPHLPESEHDLKFRADICGTAAVGAVGYISMVRHWHPGCCQSL